MTDIPCPKCGYSEEHYRGYGLAAGPMGCYTFCGKCNTLLEFSPDLDDLSEEAVKRIQEWAEKQHKSVWGDVNMELIIPLCEQFPDDEPLNHF